MDKAGHGRTRLGHLVVLLACLAPVPACHDKRTRPAPPPPVVDVIAVEPQTLPIVQEWIATLDGLVNAQVRAQVTGYLLTQNYVEGHAVKKGDLMFRIDPRTFEAALGQAKSKLMQDEAQREKARLDVERYTPLAQEQAISKEELVNAVQARSAAEALVKADRATVRSADLNLGFTKIVSPIDGLAGIALAQIGDLVSPSSGALTNVSTIDPIKAYFYASERDYFDFWQAHLPLLGQAGDVELELVLANDDVYPHKGHVAFADRQVNPSTGTLQIVGVFPNPQLLLRPGQTARVRTRTQLARDVLAVPQQAMSELQNAFRVAVVAEHDVVDLRRVEAGKKVGPLWIVERGLHPGDRVVVEGLQKVKPGQPVQPHVVAPPSLDTPESPGATGTGPSPGP